MELSSTVNELIQAFQAERPGRSEGQDYNVSRTVSILAVLYEKARNAVEFRAEHLIRRAAIERILKRRILINGGSTSVAESLITELLWARYIDSSLVDEAKIAETQRIINRYLIVKQMAATAKPVKISWDMIWGLASAEIDETLVSAKKREALINFFYQAVRPKITIPAIDQNRTNILAYIATERAYAQADDPLIAFHLLKMLLPQWLTTTQPAETLPQFLKTLQVIEMNLREPMVEPIYRYIRRQVAPYLLLRDFFLATGSKAREYLEDESKLEQKLSELASSRYQETGTRVRRAVVRSFIYIFLTKMLFALALEAPYDLYIAKRVTYLPLVVNTIFPPLMLFLVAGLFSVPGAENTRKLIERCKKILYHFDELKNEPDVFTLKPRVRRPMLVAFFSLWYLATFGITFGLINLALTRLHFNVISQIIFVFFVALVSFFAYRIRASAKEYEVVERQGILEPVFDFFFLPILRAGHFLSREIAKLNIFIFIFDFILEAPLKVIFEVAEEWIRFVRAKKEEII